MTIAERGGRTRSRYPSANHEAPPTQYTSVIAVRSGDPEKSETTSGNPTTTAMDVRARTKNASGCCSSRGENAQSASA